MDKDSAKHALLPQDIRTTYGFVLPLKLNIVLFIHTGAIAHANYNHDEYGFS